MICFTSMLNIFPFQLNNNNTLLCLNENPVSSPLINKQASIRLDFFVRLFLVIEKCCPSTHLFELYLGDRNSFRTAR